jgi:hypothetical protein
LRREFDELKTRGKRAVTANKMREQIEKQTNLLVLLARLGGLVGVECDAREDHIAHRLKTKTDSKKTPKKQKIISQKTEW